MNANFEQMVEKHGVEEATKRLEEIRDLGGYGNVPIDYVGGFDVFGAIDPTNPAVSEKDKDRIAELAGVSRKDADHKVKGLKDGDGNYLPGQVITREMTTDATPKFPKAAR